MAKLAPPPNATNPVLNDNGLFTHIWYRFMAQMWEKLGGAIDRFEVNAPPGEVTGFAGSSAPSGWLICDGSAVSRVGYADLFAAIGTTWGVGDGSTTFNLPDFRGRMLVGVGTGAGLSPRALADTGGAEDVTLVANELPTITPTINDAGHTHTVNDAGHAHTITDSGHAHGAVGVSFLNSDGTTEYSTGAKGSLEGATASATTGISVDSATTGVTNNNATTGITINSFGNDQAHENMPPFAAINYIIKT